MKRNWAVVFVQEFSPEFEALAPDVQDRLAAHLAVLGERGPDLGRPLVDTLKGAQHSNMKELRFAVGRQIWRFAFAFDPARQCVVLVGGDKAGSDQTKFYGKLIREADIRYSNHIRSLAAERRK